MYLAIIGDLVSSRQLRDRQAVQKKLVSALDEINELFEAHLASRFSITLGDEFQGVLHSPEQAMAVLFRLKYLLFPVRIRFGVGLGEISTQINPKESLGADGPAYHAARQMIQEVRRAESGKKSLSCDIRIGAVPEAECLETINAGLCLMHYMETHWTEKQRENIQDSLLSGLNQTEIARRRGLNQSSVHRSLKSAGYYEYEYAYRELQMQLSRIFQEL